MEARHCRVYEDSRVQQVSERIYRNHLQTRFCNQQEQYKLKHKIVELEKLEKDSWVALNNQKRELQNRFKRITDARKPVQIPEQPTYHSGSSSSNQYLGFTIGRQDQQSVPRGSTHNLPKQTNHLKKINRKLKNSDRKPSYTSLLKPYRPDDYEYKEVLGYAQHLTKKATRKSSTDRTDIRLQFERENTVNYQKYRGSRYFSKNQRRIMYDVKQSAKELISMGIIDPKTQINRNVITKQLRRKISFLPPPIMKEEENPRYVRVPVAPLTQVSPNPPSTNPPSPNPPSPNQPSPNLVTPISEIHDEREMSTLYQVLSPIPSYTLQMSHDTVVSENIASSPKLQQRRRSSLDDLNADEHEHPRRRSFDRRGSRSLCDAEMRRYLPYLGRCPSPIDGLGSTFSDRLNLFAQKMVPHTTDIGMELSNTAISHIAPPPRDDLLTPLTPDISPSQTSETQPDTDTQADTRLGGLTPDPDKSPRLSSIDPFEIGKWRQTMAVTDTLPNIITCKYLRKPNSERYDPETNQYYEVEQCAVTEKMATENTLTENKVAKEETSFSQSGDPKQGSQVHMSDVVRQLLDYSRHAKNDDTDGKCDEDKHGNRESDKSND